VGFRFNLWNSFDGSHTAQITFGALRLVCSNGLVAMGKNASSIAIRHTKNANIRFNDAVKVWAGSEQWYNIFVENCKHLTQKLVDQKMVNQFLDSLFNGNDSKQAETKKQRIEQLFQSGKGNNGTSAWDLLNGVTEYIDHESKKTEEDRIENSNIGQGYDIKDKAFRLAMAL